jgi:hypothetical protein
MGFFDDAGATISSAVDSASTAVSGVTSSISNAVTAVEGGLASGLSAVKDGIGGLSNLGSGLSLDGVIGNISSAFGGIASLVKSAVKPLPNVKLPLPNPLFDYASYTYQISLATLTQAEINSPDTTYRTGKVGRLLAKSANIDPNNRPQTAYGKFDFYIEDLTFTSQIGFEKGSNSNLTSAIKFKIIEPYSMGMFFLAAQQLAQQKNPATGKPEWGNWRVAPWLLIIQFRGNTEIGQITTIPGTSRYIPIRMTQLVMNVTEQGAVYDVTGQVDNHAALSNANTKFKSDHAVRGNTVQEMLQKGEKSLQAVMNKKLQDVADANGIENPDKMLFLFPADRSSAGVTGSGENSDGATTDVNAQAVYAKLGVSVVDGELIQSATNTNKIGLASMSFDDTRKADAPVGKDNDVYDDKGNLKRGKNTVNPTVTDMKFSQDTDITNAINQVIMQSSYVTSSLDPAALTPEGYRTWWNIDVQMYPIGPENKATGEKPKLIVYRVLEYMVHNSSGPVPSETKPYGYTNLAKQAVKEYNYIYTGKNTDVIKFEIKFESNFQNAMTADGFSGTMDNKTAAQSSSAEKEKNPQNRSLPAGQEPDTTLGVFGTAINKFTRILSGTDKAGGGGLETQAVRSARLFHDTITKGRDMNDLNLEIIGDPYFIVQSGQGNYTSKHSQFYNLAADGSIDFQSGEVDIMVNFRTPVDINQGTGLYDFGKNNATAPLEGFSGLYQIRRIENTFRSGNFTQKLIGNRRPNYESKKEPTKEQVYATRTQNNSKDENSKEK